jgi:uncharacterized membrane protein YeaQ/YmgE (transglycosylase-associated protein family)
LTPEVEMGVLSWPGSGIVMDIVLGIVGAIVGGYLATLAGYGGVTGVNLYSIVVAVIGAVIVLLVYHVIAART